jgi:hypothetical protein
VRVTDHVGDTIERGQFFRRTLSVTTGNDNLRARIRAMDLAHGVARLRVGGRGDGASVQYDDVSHRVVVNKREACCREVSAECGCVGIGGAAAEILDGKGRHEKTHALRWGACSEIIARMK